jgi:hypothetical protein
VTNAGGCHSPNPAMWWFGTISTSTKAREPPGPVRERGA